MQNLNNLFRTIILFFLPLLFYSCSKYLDKKPSANLAIPTTLADLQSLLDNQGVMNNFFSGLGESSADNYYMRDASYNVLPLGNRNVYTWNEDIYAGGSIGNNPYAVIYVPVYFSNIVLENLEQIHPTGSDVDKWRQIKGAALFYRSRCFHVVAVNWAQAYVAASSSTDLGIPLRLSSDFNIPSTRSTLAQTYTQIIKDLEEAITELPVRPPHVMRPSKSAAYALLSRVYLAMQDYTKSGLYADSALQITSSLMDFNALSATSNAPIPAFNPEVILHASGNLANVAPSFAIIDTVLFKQYADNDLRKTIFFKNNGDGSYSFKGSYFGSSVLFTGLATDELYLNKSECLVRQGKINEGLAVLDSLLIKRWKKGTFNPLTASSQLQAMQLVLAERRKELVMREMRWMDLKRLNLDPQWQVTLRRVIAGQDITLPPGDKRYALQFPQSAIDLSGIIPNPR